MSSVVHFVNNIDAMVGALGPRKFATLSPQEKRECTMYYGLRELSEEVAELKTMLLEQRRHTAQIEDALRVLTSRTR